MMAMGETIATFMRAGGASGDSPARVLLVEDDPKLPEVLASVLAHDGLEIECVATGA